MRKNFGCKPYVYPQPVFILGTYDEEGTPNAMNAAWGGIYDDDKIFVCLSSHKTTDNILRNKAFTISVADLPHLKQADYVGMVSGNDVKDKVQRCGLTPVKAEFVNAPMFLEFPICLECVLDEELSVGVVGKVVNVSIDERVLDENGNVDPEKLQAISYDTSNHNYLLVSKTVGKAFNKETVKEFNK